LLFLIYINDVVDSFPDYVLASLFADDSNAKFSDTTSTYLLQKLKEVNTAFHTWAKQNGLGVNEDKTATLVFRDCAEKLALQSDPDVTLTTEVKFLGLWMDDKLSFSSHVDEVCKKLSSAIFCLKTVRDWAGSKLLLSIYHALFESHISYGILVWGNLPECHTNRILKLQKYAIRTMLRKTQRTSCRLLFPELGILTFPSLYMLNAVCYAHTQYRCGIFISNNTVTGFNTRSSGNIFRKYVGLKKVQNSITNHAPILFNKLPQSLKSIHSTQQFYLEAKKYFLAKGYYSTRDFLL
jgi:hypothetical protein